MKTKFAPLLRFELYFNLILTISSGFFTFKTYFLLKNKACFIFRTVEFNKLINFAFDYFNKLDFELTPYIFN
jgi:hypothetical protein